jgi:hypothetical protein
VVVIPGRRLVPRRGRLSMEKISLAEKFALIREHWRPKVVGELNEL